MVIFGALLVTSWGMRYVIQEAEEARHVWCKNNGEESRVGWVGWEERCGKVAKDGIRSRD